MPKDVSFFLPVNLRFRVQPNINFAHTRLCVLACNINLLYSDFGKYDNMINESKYVDNMLAESIKNGSIFDLIFNFIEEKYIDTSKTDINTIYKIQDLQRTCDVILSNTGTYVSDKIKVVDGPLKIDELYYGDSLKSYPSQHNPFILHVHTFNERLMFQLSTNKTKISSSCAQRFLELFEKHFRSNIM